MNLLIAFFAAVVYGLLKSSDQFTSAVWAKIARSSIEEIAELAFKALFILKSCTSHRTGMEAKIMVISK